MNKTTTLLLGLLLAIYSCSPQSQETDATPINSTLAFQLDYANWQLTDSKDLASFQNLFEKATSITLANINILDGDKSIYNFNQGLGELTINKTADNNYSIMEYYMIPMGNVYGKVALLRYILDSKEGSLKRDKSFQPQFRVYKYWYNHLVKEYDSHLSDSSYTAKNWDNVPHAAFDVMRFLMFNLTLATLEGCTECQERINKIADDYSFVNSAEYSQNLMVCNAILTKFKD